MADQKPAGTKSKGARCTFCPIPHNERESDHNDAVRPGSRPNGKST